MNITRNISQLLSSNMFIIEEGLHIIIIDPFVNERIIDTLIKEGKVIDYIFLTHEHYDHISGVNWLKNSYGGTVVCGALCAQNIQNIKKNFSTFFSAFCEIQEYITVTKEMADVKDYICTADKIIANNNIITWQGHSIKAFETPGHSPGSVCYLLDSKYLFSGDSLLKDFPVQLRFPGGNKKQYLEVTMPFLHGLANDIFVYPGHHEPFYLKEIANRQLIY